MIQYCGKHSKYIRGQINSYKATLKRAKRDGLEVIEKELPAAEEAYRNSLLQSDSNYILKLKYEYNHILGESIDNLLLKLKQRHFELGVKPKKLLTIILGYWILTNDYVIQISTHLNEQLHRKTLIMSLTCFPQLDAASEGEFEEGDASHTGHNNKTNALYL